MVGRSNRNWQVKKVWEEYPTHYAKEKNKWWCNYTGQDTVVIEEADPKNMEHLADRLKVWADRYPFPGEIKGGRIEGSDHSRSLSRVTTHQKSASPTPMI